MNDLTDAQIDAMPAGREMDAEVGRLVMGWRVKHRGLMIRCLLQDGTQQPLPHFSEDIAAAWQIVEVFRRGWNGHAAVVIEMTVYDDIGPEDCGCKIYGPDMRDVAALGDEMPLAISRVALKAALRSKEAGR